MEADDDEEMMIEEEQFTAYLVNLTTGERQVFPADTARELSTVRHVLFSPDDCHLVVMGRSSALVIDMKGRYIKCSLLQCEDSMYLGGANDHHILEETTRILKNNHILIASTKYGQYTSLCDLQTGHKLFDLWRKDTDQYACDKMTLNADHTLAAMATASSSVVNGNRQKDCVVWNLQTGQVHAVIPNTEGWFSALQFCGEREEYLVCCHEYSSHIVDIWYVGTLDQPLPHTQAVKVSLGQFITD